MTAALYVVTALLTLVWLGLLFRALLADRSRGRRRCPKCFYEIDKASGFKCSECGTTAKDERALAKTHRHWERAVLVTFLVLAPALLTGGIAGFQQYSGWSDLPAPIITRLLWLDNANLDKDVLARIRRGELSHAHAERIVLAACKMLESERTAERARGFAYLTQFGRNSGLNVESTPEVPRPMLEELRPDISIPILLKIAKGQDAADIRRAVYTLKYLQDIDPQVVIALLQFVNHPDTSISERAIYALNGAGREGESVKRLHWLNYHYQNSYRGFKGPSDIDLLKSFALEVQAHGDDRDSLLEWAKRMAEGDRDVHRDIQSEAELIGRRSLALWLLCRVDQHGELSWPAVELAVIERKVMLDTNAIEHIYGFAWSEEVEELLRATIRRADGKAISAQRVAVKYKLEASGLIPDLLWFVSRIERVPGISSTAQDFIAIGGNPQVLHDTIVNRLETILRDSPDQVLADQKDFQKLKQISINMDFGWLADLAIADPRTGDLMRAYMKTFRGQSAELWAAVAYAAITGDKAAVTQTFLDRDRNLWMVVGSYSDGRLFLDLINRDLADVDMLVAHFVDTEDAAKRAAFASFLGTHASSEVAKRFETALRKLENDPDPATAAAAAKALQAIKN